jgi:transcriptional regulator with XRE-family HTH domain
VTATAGRLSTGVDDLDELLTGLIPGDNIVWATSDVALVNGLEEAFLDEAGRRRLSRTYVTTSAEPAALHDRFGPDLVVLDARPGGDHAKPGLLEHVLLQRAKETAPACLVFDGLDSFARRWGRPAALSFFTRVCPALFDLAAIAYWRIPRREVGDAFVEGVAKVTQCVLEIGRDHVRVVKAEGRGASVQGQLLRLGVEDDVIRLRNERALGRLARGLERIRHERNLSQAELARLAGVTPSAISQAEAGRRGLSLDTLVVLAERLGTGVDDLLVSDSPSGYVLARRDRTGASPPHTALLDDPNAGLRAYLIRLGAEEEGTPPLAHKGVEMVLVSSGLVQVAIGSETPVMRAGDALLATAFAVSGWRNLMTEPARLFWILRD